MNDNMNRGASDVPSDEMLAMAAPMQPTAMQDLIHRYEKTVYRIANSLAQNYADAEDYAEEGLLGLVAAISAFSMQKNVSFKTFATVCIQNRIRSAYAKRRVPDEFRSLSIDDPDSFEESMLCDDSPSPELVYLQKERISELYERMESVLSRLEQEIFSQYLSGYSYAEIAKCKGISEKSVDNAILRAKRKLRAVWSNFGTAPND